MLKRTVATTAMVSAAALVVGCGVTPEPAERPGAQASRMSATAPEFAGLARSIDPCPRSAGVAPTGGSRLPAIELTCLGLGPRSINLAHLSGRPTLVNLWATWCGPCREEMPALQAAHRRYGQEVQFLGVNTRDDPQGATQFLDEVGVSYAQVLDQDAALLTHLGARGLPVTLMLDARGQVVDKHVGPLDRTDIDRLIAQAN